MILNRRLFIAVAAVTASIAGPAWAHARLVSASPARDAVGSSPAAIRLTFSERMVAAFSSLEVINAAGVAQPIRVVVSDDSLTLTGTPSRRLAAGVYSVNWAIASNDGHRMTGSYRFTVR